MAKLISFRDSSGKAFIRAIPLVVTTADLFHARFNHNRIALRNGMIEANDVVLEALPFCAVNYAATDDLAIQSKHSSFSRTNMQNDLMYWQYANRVRGSSRGNQRFSEMGQTSFK